MLGHSGQMAAMLAFVKMWTASLEQSLESLDVYREAQSHTPGEDERAGVSLVLRPETRDLALIHWTIPGKCGRVADLDSNHYLKAIVPVGAKRHPLQVAPHDIIMPVTGAVVLREKRSAKKSSRSSSDLNRLADPVVRFMHMFRVAKSKCDGGVELISCEVCFICESQNDVEGSKLQVCPMCLLASHDPCCGEVAKRFDFLADGKLSSPSYSSSSSGQGKIRLPFPLPSVRHDSGTRYFPDLFKDPQRQATGRVVLPRGPSGCDRKPKALRTN